MATSINTAGLPRLEGWQTVPEAASDLGVTRQRFYQMVNEGKIQTVHTIGRRPVLIVRTAEIVKLVRERAESEVEAEAEAAAAGKGLELADDGWPTARRQAELAASVRREEAAETAEAALAEVQLEEG